MTSGRLTERTIGLWAGLGIAALAAPMIALGVFHWAPALDPVYMAPTFHFYVVSFTALAAAFACAVVIGSAQTLQNTRLLFLGLAFLIIAGVFSVHGLATPGFIVDRFYMSVSVSAWLSAAAGSALVALSVVNLPDRVEHAIERNGRAIAAVAVAAVVAYIYLSLRVEAWLQWVPIRDAKLQWPLAICSFSLSGFACWRYFQAWQFARLPSQLAMMATLVLLMEVQAIILWGTAWHLSWWIYHALYGVAFIVLFTGWAMEVRRAGTLRAIADALSMRDALAQLNHGLAAPIVALVDAVEAKDKDTFGHVRRVSGYALAIGRRLGLPPSELRALTLAAEMHDVGKISIPDSILAKPGPLSDEEFTIVKTHTQRGYDIAHRVRTLEPLADIIRHHHERLDGSGYPDGLAGEQIPLLSRIIAVADTYDAMTSKRPYRDAMSHSAAIAELGRLRGVLFDARCVTAFAAVVDEPSPREDHQAAA